MPSSTPKSLGAAATWNQQQVDPIDKRGDSRRGVGKSLEQS